MLRTLFLFAAGAAAALAATVSKPVECVWPQKGLVSLDFSSNSVLSVLTFRTSPDSTFSVRGTASDVEEQALTDRVGSVQAGVITADYLDTVLLDLRPRCAEEDLTPQCTLEVLVPPGVEFRAAADQGVITIDRLATRPVVEMRNGQVFLLNHGRSAYVSGGAITCTISDPGPDDKVVLRSGGGVTGLRVYYPDSLDTGVSAMANYGNVYVEGIRADRAQGGWGGPEKFRLNYGASARLLDLQNQGDIVIRPLSAYGKEE